MVEGAVGGGVRELVPGLSDVNVSALYHNYATLIHGFDGEVRVGAKGCTFCGGEFGHCPLPSLINADNHDKWPGVVPVLKGKARQKHRESMMLDVEKDLQVVKRQQALLFALEAPKITFQTRVHTVEKDETCSHSTASQSFLSSITEVLDDYTRERLDQPLSLDELTKGPESLEKNKTSGSDGLLTELYLALWD
eukprot:g36990.t1